jgi:hypothetical protein
MNEEDLKRAKKKVLMIHPDKSKLPPEYFIFYKKAYEIIYQYYISNLKYVHTKESTETIENQTYNARSGIDYNKGLHNAINEYSKKGGNLNQHINEIYDQNFRKTPNEKKQAWFKDETDMFGGQIKGISAGNINSAFNDIKKQQANMALSVYNGGIQQLYNIGGSVGGTSLYDDDDDDDDDQDQDHAENTVRTQNSSNGRNNYISCDPFSKLKYDDLRKVHKDQTVFHVNEHDFDKVRRYANEKEMMAERGKQINPLEKEEADNMLKMEYENYRRKMAEKQYRDKLRADETEMRMREVSSRFLQLKH